MIIYEVGLEATQLIRTSAHSAEYSYFHDWKNLYDLFKFLVGIFYFMAFFAIPDYRYKFKFFFDHTEERNFHYASLQSLSFSILIACQWINLIEHLRFFERMRIFLEVIKQTIYDVVPFLSIFLFCLMAVHDFVYFKHEMAVGN